MARGARSRRSRTPRSALHDESRKGNGLSSAVQLPFLSEFDPPQRSEGSLDPMGLRSIADQLGVRLASGVSERQWNPRYLTMALVGMAACDDALVQLGEEKGIPAWQVYEWVVVTALVREWRGTREVQGIPGHEKVEAALGANDVVCERTYLQAARVFGFHGIYRVLGIGCGLFDSSARPLEPGMRILRAWQADQNLDGFVSGSGPGREFRQAIHGEVKRGIEAGHAREAPKWLRDLIAKHLTPHSAGRTEAPLLWEMLLANDALRREYAELLISAEGQTAWVSADFDERKLHEWVLDRGSGQLRQLVSAAQCYERLTRHVHDAWEESLYRLTEERRAMSAAELSESEAVRALAREGARLFESAVPELGVVDPKLRVRAEGAFNWLGESQDPVAVMERLLAHHVSVQRRKSHAGKRPWLDQLGDGRVAVRPGYTRDSFTARPHEYVNSYRALPLWNFASQLGRVDSNGRKPHAS